MPDYHDPSVHQQNRLDSLSLDVIQEYFAQLNPIAQRIAYDIRDTKVNYGKLWDTLNYHEQNDIINETLIKPEISLHYFDNFPTPTQSASSKSHTSTDSLAAIVFNDFGKLQDEEERKNKQVLPLKQFDAKYNVSDSKECGYAFDGRNLGTYSVQTVALKVVQDDVLGRFRDEHSRPFSYRTKSQINLHIFHSNNESPSRCDRRTIEHFQLKSLPATKEQAKLEPIDAESRKAMLNYQRLQCELKKSLTHNMQKSRPTEVQKISNINVKPGSIASPSTEATHNRKNKAKHEAASANSYKDKDTCSNTKSKANKSSSSLIQVFLNSNNVTGPSSSTVVNYAVYTDAFLDGEEKANLMQHCGHGEFLSASSSSAATSEDDEYDIRTDKALDSEEVFLLDNDLNMRKGFDFLNNW